MQKLDEKVRENKARRAAERQGLRLMKSRRRDANAIDHGKYMLCDLRTKAAVWGHDSSGNAEADLTEIEDYLAEAKAPAAAGSPSTLDAALDVITRFLRGAPGITSAQGGHAQRQIARFVRAYEAETREMQKGVGR